jgi:nitric oxide reductase subunit B
MRATAKYFWVVCALFVGQVLLGIVTAHYAVEGQGLYGLPFAEYLPYDHPHMAHAARGAVDRHGMAGDRALCRADARGTRPQFQRLGVNFLFVSLLIIVIGSFAGQCGRPPLLHQPDSEFLVRASGL